MTYVIFVDSQPICHAESTIYSVYISIFFFVVLLIFVLFFIALKALNWVK